MAGVAEQTPPAHFQRVASVGSRVQSRHATGLDRDAFLRSLKTAPRGSSPGPGGCTYEHLKVLMDDQDTLELLFEAATSLAQAKVPASVAVALTTARLTALSKRDGGVRGIATGCSFRRLVARTLAKQFAEDFEQECSPFQYALSTRTGTDCVCRHRRQPIHHGAQC